MQEEVGLDIATNVLVKLGRIYHDYGDKEVQLHVYDVELNSAQYDDYKNSKKGSEGQRIFWVEKKALLSGDILLPAANAPILSWLKIPDILPITYTLESLKQKGEVDWVGFHNNKLEQDGCVYLRPSASAEVSDAENANVVFGLLEKRPDIKAIINCELLRSLEGIPSNQVFAQQMSHGQLMSWYEMSTRDNESGQQIAENDDKSKSTKKKAHEQINTDSNNLDPSLPIMVSCHDDRSVAAANLLAASRLENKQAPVMGVWLSPVRQTASHPETVGMGWAHWHKLAEQSNVPVIALGGLTPDDCEEAKKYGAYAVSGIRAFLN